MRVFPTTNVLLVLIVVGLGAGERLAYTAEESATDSGPNRFDPLVGLLLEVTEPTIQTDVLKGLAQAVKGQRDLPMPEKWPQVARQLSKSPSAEVRQLAQSLSLIFGDPETRATLRKAITAGNAPLKERKAAIAALTQVRDPKLLPILLKAIATKELREPALQGLAGYDSAEIPKQIFQHYSEFEPAERQSALHTLVSRRSYAAALLDALEQKQVPAQDLSTYLVRQIAAFDDEALNEKLRNTWGEFRPTSADKVQRIQAYKSQLTEALLKKADPALGRQVFAKNCAGCHILFNEGRQVGPNLTGAQRNNVDYILENVVDPSAVVGRDFRLTTIATAEGRVLTGVVAEETTESLTLKTPTEDVVIATSEIEDRKQSQLSMMPEGLFDKLTEAEIRDLVAYLASPTQVPLPKD